MFDNDIAQDTKTLYGEAGSIASGALSRRPDSEDRQALAAGNAYSVVATPTKVSFVLDDLAGKAKIGAIAAINAAMHALTRRDRGGPSRSDLAEQQLPAAVPSRTWLCCGGVVLPEEVALEELCVASELLRVRAQEHEDEAGPGKGYDAAFIEELRGLEKKANSILAAGATGGRGVEGRSKVGTRRNNQSFIVKQQRVSGASSVRDPVDGLIDFSGAGHHTESGQNATLGMLAPAVSAPMLTPASAREAVDATARAR